MLKFFKKKKNTDNKLIKEKKVEGMGFMKKAKFNIYNKNNANLDKENNSLENLSKEKKSLSKNSSTSKNKNNLNIKTIHEKNTDNLYNNEEKNYLKLDEVNRLNLPSHKRFKSKKGNKRLKDLKNILII